MASDNFINNEVYVKNSNLEQIDFFIKACNSVCKILIPSEQESGSGFFLKTIKGNQPFYCLISCEHVLKSSYIEKKKIIKVYYENHNKSIDILLDDSKRFIRQYPYMDIDATVVEIKSSDNIDEIYFLSFNINYLKDFSGLENKKIFIIQYPLAGPLKKSEGKILSVDKYRKNLSYNASTNKGSSGSPIFLENTSLVIGLHKQGFLLEEKNYGNFIGPIVCSLMNDGLFINFRTKNYLLFQGEIQIKDDFVELFGKHFLNEGIYFFGTKIGQMEIKQEEKEEEEIIHHKIIVYDNGIRYIGNIDNFKSFGEGIIYINNKVYYKGEFAYGMKEGNGTIYFENSDYYIGEFNKDEIDGKGIIYNKDNELKYEGEFVNGKKCGYGNLIGNDLIYSGQFKDNLFHGKGKLQTNSGLNYEGDFVNGFPKGEGQCTYENGNFYIGEFLNGLRHGNGIYFSSDGNIIYKGTFASNKYDGEGTLYLKEGKYYVGDFKNGEKNGHGVVFDKEKIILEAQFNKGKVEGSYKLFNGNKYSIGEHIEK